MNESTSMLCGIGLGAAAMYFLDPVQGRRRRALARDQCVRAAHQAEQFLGAAGSDLRNRAAGAGARAGSLFEGGGAPDDRVLTERVRSKMGRYVSHPHAIRVTAQDGRVTLAGNILAREVQGLINAAEGVPGVTAVENRLTPHEQAGNISDLQGGVEPAGEPWELMQANWSPTARLLAGTIGGALVGFGLTQRFPASCVLGTVGCALLARCALNPGRATAGQRNRNVRHEGDGAPRRRGRAERPRQEEQSWTTPAATSARSAFVPAL